MEVTTEKNLQDWMNLFWFIMNEPKDRYDKVLKFIKMAIMSPKRVKYRDALSKKDTINKIVTLYAKDEPNFLYKPQLKYLDLSSNIKHSHFQKLIDKRHNKIEI